MNPSNACIIVFAKAPVPGQVKTRLIPTIGAQAASRLHGLLVEHVVGVAATAGLADVQLWCAPSTDHNLFGAMQQRHGLSLHQQHGSDLGERMYNAFCEALAQYPSVLIVGTDCPTLQAADYEQALEALRHGHDAAIAPAHDGGYVLLGLNRVDPRLFDAMPWGTGQVYPQTQTRLISCGYQWKELQAHRDLDHYDDLLYLQAGAGEGRLGQALTQTLNQLASLAGN